MGMRPSTIAALAILAAVLIVPAFMLNMEPYKANNALHEQCTVVPREVPGPVYHPPNKLKDGRKCAPRDDTPKDGAPEDHGKKDDNAGE